MIPAEAFADIIKELERKPLEVNKYRNRAGEGRSQTFGVVGRRSLDPDYSRMNWMRPMLYKLLLDFAEKYVDISWNAITLNQGYKAEPHRDRNNQGDSFLVAFGDFTGGRLKIHEGDLSGCHDICYKPIRADFSKILHSVEDFTGQRYSLVYYNFVNSRLKDLPPPSVRQEGDKYFFYRGEEKISSKTGLPHPLRNRKKDKQTEGMKIQKGQATVSFS